MLNPPSAEIMPDVNLARMSDQLQAFLAQCKAGFDVKRKPLRSLLIDLASPDSSFEIASARPPDGLRRVASAFAAIANLVRRQDRCLPLSVAFKKICAARQIPVRLVFGVSLDPFAAHCWVQQQECVANDTVERVRLFTPILVV